MRKEQITAKELTAYKAAGDAFNEADDELKLAANRQGMAGVMLEKLHRKLTRRYRLREGDVLDIHTGEIRRKPADVKDAKK